MVMENVRNVNRMDLRAVYVALMDMGLMLTASFLVDYANDRYYTIDKFLIDVDVVRRHVGDKTFRELECKCDTYMPLSK